MIFENSDSGEDAPDVSHSLPPGARPIPLPVLQQVQSGGGGGGGRERERVGSASSAQQSQQLTYSHERSPSLPVAPLVNVEEVDGETGGGRGKRPNLPSVSGLARTGRRSGHVKAPSADWSSDINFARKGSPSDLSFDSDSSESFVPLASQIPPAALRARTLTMDSDTLVLSMGRDMVKQGSELSDTGSLIVPSARGGLSDNDSAEEADYVIHERKLLYLMVARCIAYPFNAKYQLETAPPKPKLNEGRFQGVLDILEVCRGQDWETLARSAISLSPTESKCARNEKFLNCLDWYMDNVLGREDVVAMSHSGSFSVKELESVFKVLAMKHIMYTSNQLDVDSSELHAWCSTFRKLVEHGARTTSRWVPPSSGGRSVSPGDTGGGGGAGGTGPNREKLYKLFQRILNIKSIEHQILYRVCQLGVKEEQEAVVRRELHKRELILKDLSSQLQEGKFGSRRVEEIYREEEIKHLKALMLNLDHLSLATPGANPNPSRKKKLALTDFASGGLTKQNLSFSLKLKVTVQELQGMTTPTEGKRIFCVFDLVDGGNDPLQTHPELVSDVGGASFDITGEFWTHSPLPEIRYTLRRETKGLFSDDRIIAKRTVPVMPTSAEMSEVVELHRSDKDTSVVAKLKTLTLLERPPNMRKCGYLFSEGDFLFRQRRKRFCTLMQQDQYKFVLCTYNTRDTQPRDILPLDDFNVDYLNDEEDADQSDATKEATQYRYKFVLISEEGKLKFGCRDDQDRKVWVQWIYRATGQNYQPSLETQGEKKSGSKELDRYGLSSVVEQDIVDIERHKMFESLFRSILEYRLKEDAFSRGLFSPEQLYILDEFCARYGVRDPFRHFTCLREWMAREEEGVAIWPVMMLSSFRFCQMHVGGINPPEKKVIATREEQESLTNVSVMIEDLLVKKLENFRSHFPFGCPKDDLKVTFKLFNLVTAMNHKGLGTTDDSPETVLTLALERAALVNYKMVYDRMEASVGEDVQVSMPLLFSLIGELAHFCIEYMYELHDFYWEDFTQVSGVFTKHINAFWMLFLVDLRETMKSDDNILLKLRLFHTVNQYFCSQPTMKLGEFHRAFLDNFTPVVIQYMEGLETSMREDLARSFSQEEWMPVSECCNAVRLALVALQSLNSFLQDLNWPDPTLSVHLKHRVRSICVDRFQEASDYTQEQLGLVFSSRSLSLSSSLPPEVFTIINTLVHLNDQLLPICIPGDAPLISHDNKNIEDHLSSAQQLALTLTIDRLCDPLASLLSKLARYDPSDSIFASLKNLVQSSVPVGSYALFLSTSLSSLGQHLVARILPSLVLNWYEAQLGLLQEWLNKRPSFSLHPEQLTAISTLVQVVYSAFEETTASTQQLESDTYLSVQDRLRIEKSKDDLLSMAKR